MMAHPSTERTVQQIEAEIERARLRAVEVNGQIASLRAERDALNDLRSVLREQLLDALGRELQAAEESKPEKN